MSRKIKILLWGIAVIVTVVTIFALLRDANIPVLEPKGLIATQQRDLIIFATILMLLIVVPVFILTFFIVWRYRESNTKAVYRPKFVSNTLLETVWWGFPLIIILVLSVVIWKSSHDLDPVKPLVSTRTPLEVKVVALQWKWLFIYPEQNIATVNYLNIPVDTPINLTLTADAPMNSFWVPQLGGQIYAMSGMSTKLHLNATSTGSYAGSSANLSGEGFAGMRFKVNALKQQDYNAWLSSTKAVPTDLSNQAYDKLALPSTATPITTYGSYQPDLYDTIVMKYGSHDMKMNTEATHGH